MNHTQINSGDSDVEHGSVILDKVVDKDPVEGSQALTIKLGDLISPLAEEWKTAPENPQNWTTGKKIFNSAVPAVFSFIV